MKVDKIFHQFIFINEGIDRESQLTLHFYYYFPKYTHTLLII
jgi:hypothetical protein